MAKFFAQWFHRQPKRQPKHKAPKWQPVTYVPYSAAYQY